ncbi:MAG: hypothetical protein ABIN67_01550 [Ferruginibacter sp.]
MKQKLPLFITLLLLSISGAISAQTSWTGITSTNWATATNWTAGVPLITTDVIIGDASFTGAFQPAISATANAKTITIGGAVISQLTVAYTLTVKGDITVNSNATLINGSASISLTGNWINNGSYSTTSSNASVIFNGTSQTLGGTAVTTFRKLTVNLGSILTLTNNINSAGTSSIITVNGTLNPNESPSFLTTAENLTINNGAILKVNAALFASNYVISTAFLLNAGSIVDYSATAVNQVISSSYSYSTLRITGAGIKSLAANLPALRSTSSTVGYLSILSGTLDLGIYTANRGTTVVGGTLSVSNGAFLKIGGASNYPTGYNTNTFTLTSTVEYNGVDQTVVAKTYGNLILSSSAGAAIKTMPVTAFTVAGSFTSTVGSGTSVAYTAASNITVNSIMTIGTGTTFSGATFSHSIANWVNNGTFTPGTSTITIKGTGSVINGTAAHNFNNLTITATNVSVASGIDLFIAGNLTTSGVGAFTQAAGNITMSGTTKIISGVGISLNNLIVTGVITTASSFDVVGDVTVSGSLIASAGNITMKGAGKIITNSGTLTFKGLITSGSISTANSFTVSSALNCIGSFVATAGTITFTSSSLLSGTVNLFNITINGTSLALASNSVMGVAGAFNVTAGSLNVTSYIPNTVNYNNAGSQTIKGTSYNNLILSNGGTKTAGAAITVNNALTISASTTFDAVTFTHTILGNWTNNGTFTQGTSLVQFTGATNSTVSGATTFYNVTINKTLATYNVTLLNNVNVSTINMTRGSLKTGSNTLTITTTRTGNDFIIGTITRTHAFVASTAYAFEGPNNLITFAAGVSGVTSITVSVVIANVSDFPFGAGVAIGRYYTIAIPSGTYNATLRLHYEDAELNGNNEANMQLWKYNGAAWAVSGKTGNSTTTNYVEKSGLTNITDRWTMTDNGSVLDWNGSVSSDWSTAANWTLVQGTFSGAPTSTDIAQIGVASFTNQPIITTAAAVKSISFGSAKAATLSLNSGGSLTVNGSINGTWLANATHAIDANNQSITITGDLRLSDDVANHVINLNIGTGTITITGTLTQSGGANINFTGAGTLNIGKDFDYASGTFTPGTGLVKYTGSVSQVVAAVPYNNLTIIKTLATIANLSGATTIGGNLIVTTGEFDISNTVTINGSVTISTTAILDGNAGVLNVKTNWTKSLTGFFNAGNGTVNMTGTGTQTVSAGTFNNFNVNKTTGSVVLSGNDTLSGNLSLLAGTLNLSTFTFNHSSAGDICTIADGTSLLVSGSANFPANFVSYAIGSNSLVDYNGTIAQSVAGVTYGNLSFSNGAAVAKTISADIIVAGSLTLNSGASLDGSSYKITLFGDWNNAGNFIYSTSTIELKGGASGANKLVNGPTSFYNFTVDGFYALTPGSNLIFFGDFDVTGFLDSGFSNKTFYGNSNTSGVVSDDGISTFMGTQTQLLSFTGTFYSPYYSSSVVFKGTVTPISASTSSPTFINLEISNTSPAGLLSDVDITVLGNFLVSAGCTWNGANLHHTFMGPFTNNGTIISSGILTFAQGPPLTWTPSTTIHIGSGSAFQSTGTVEFGGPSQLIIDGAPTSFNNVVISNTNSAGISPVSDWNMTGNFSINSNSIFNASSYSHTVGGNIESNGVLNGNTSTFTMTSAGATLGGSPGTLFNNLTISGNVASVSDFYVAKDFMNNGSYDGSVGALTMTGSAASIIGGTTTPSTIAQLTISKDPGSVVTSNVTISSISALIINSGTFFTSTYGIAQNFAGGAIVVMAGATLKLGGTNTIPAFSGYGFDEASTVDYAGTTQLIANGPVYGNLTISAAGNKTATSFLPLTIAGNFTLTAGTFIANNNTHKVGGNWLMTGGTFTNTNSVIKFNGITDQSIQTIAPFNSININKTAGVVNLLSDITVNAILSFTLSKIKTSTYKVIMPSTGTVTGAAQSTGWVRGNLQKNVATGSNVSKTFEVGDSLYYSPATVLFASVTTAGNLIGKATISDHLLADYSGIDTLKSVNRFWSLINSGTVFTTATATFNWVASDLDAGTTTGNFKTAFLNGGAWVFPTMASPLSTSINATALTTFGDFIVGELASQFKWTGSALTSDWFTAMNWSGGLPNSSLNTLIPGGLTGGRVYPVLNTGTGAVNNLTIQSGASLTVTGATLQILGSISNSGSLDVSNGTVEMNGAAPQTIPSNAFLNNSILNLVINNDVTLGGQDTITGVLSFGSSNKTLTTGNMLTLKSSATGSARVAPLPVNGAGVATSFISGTVNVERYLSSKRAWRMLTAPLSNTGNIYDTWQNGGVYQVGKGTFVTGPGPSGANGLDASSLNTVSMKTFNPATQAYSNITNTKTTLLSGGTGNADNVGYFMFIRGDRNPTNLNASASNSTTLKSTGTLQTGKQVFSASGTYGQYTIMGNPYASPVDFNNIERTHILKRFYAWDPSLNQIGGYVTLDDLDGDGIYSKSIPSSSQNKNIQSGQAFFVITDTAGTANLTYYESSKSTAVSNASFRPLGMVSSFDATLNTVAADGSTNVADALLAEFNNNYSAAVNLQDAAKFANTNENLSLQRNGALLSIERRPMIVANDTLFFKLTKTTVRNYQFSMNMINMNAPGLFALLEDKYTGIATPLNMVGNTVFNFNVNSNAASSNADRFRVVFSYTSTLPVSYTSVTAKQKGKDIEVSWKVEDQLNIAHYEIEKSTDGRNFTTIGTQAVTGMNASAYNWADLNAATGDSYYRIRNVDRDGSFAYSKIVKVNMIKTQGGIAVYPNPVTNGVMNVHLSNLVAGNYTVRLVSSVGQLILMQEITHAGNSGSQKIILPKDIATGAYHLEAVHPDKITTTTINVIIR